MAQGVKNPSAMQEIPGSGRPPGEGNGKPLQCSCLENPMDGGAWWATVRVAGMQCLPAAEGTRAEGPVSQLTHQASQLGNRKHREPPGAGRGEGAERPLGGTSVKGSLVDRSQKTAPR